MKKVKIISILVFVLIATTFSGCKRDEVIQIGFIGTLTGPGSDLSISGRRGAEMAVKIVNEEGGIDGSLIRLVVGDDTNNPEKAVQCANELIGEDVKFIVGPFTSGLMIQVAQALKTDEVLLLGPTISADSLESMDDNFIRFIASTKEQADLLSDITIDQGHSKIFIVYDTRNAGFNKALVENYVNALKEAYNPIISVHAYNPSISDDLSRILRQISSEEPGAVFMIASAEDSASMAQNIKHINKDMQLYGPLWANTPELIKKGGQYVEDMIVVGAVDLSEPNEETRNFISAFYETYGESPTFASVYTYETIMILKEAIENSSKSDPITIKEYIIEKGNFQTLDGTLFIDEYGDCIRSYTVLKIESGELKRVESHD